MYCLLGRVGGTEALQDHWRQYIVATGTAIVKDEANVSVVGGSACPRSCKHGSDALAHPGQTMRSNTLVNHNS
jgi:CxxC motif-containing protein